MVNKRKNPKKAPVFDVGVIRAYSTHALTEEGNEGTVLVRGTGHGCSAKMACAFGIICRIKRLRG